MPCMAGGQFNNLAILTKPMFNKLKDLKNLQSQAKQMQQALEQEQVEVWEKGIKLTINGKMEVISLEIENHLLSEDKKEELQDSLREVFNTAVEKVQRQAAMKMAGQGLI